jgi:uncharacterized protein YndB with AHSA1/START domain
MATPDLIVSRSLQAPPAAVWQAFTSAAALEEWFWPQRFGTTAEIDLRVGGRFRIASPRAGIAVSGRYTAVQPPNHLSFTWQWDGETQESLVIVELGETGLVLTHRGLDDAARESHVTGWSDCLDRLPAWLAS